MIDAYEIGIQLMLQEDVSAGLAVINHGLAEVDRAIAATSANLAGLTREAETATKAVAVAVSSRNAFSAEGQKASGPVDQVIRGQSEQEPLLPRPSATAKAEAAAVPEMKTTKPAAPERPSADPVSDEKKRPEQDRREQIIPSSAPIRSAVEETIGSAKRETNRQPQQDLTTVSAPAQVASSGLTSGASVPSPPPDGSVPAASRPSAAARGETRGSRVPRDTQHMLTASVSREPRAAAVSVRPERALSQSASGPVARRDRATAPWSGVDHSGRQAETTRLHEKASAPQSSGRSQTESAGGTVMLDGRLVGQWLAEHMAREASRPPVGTSFFDPRQTPAWNVSGAL